MYELRLKKDLVNNMKEILQIFAKGKKQCSQVSKDSNKEMLELHRP